jgi:GMP synthase-like glutamine amidotransferase
MKHVSVIQHTQSEWLGHIEDHLEGRGIRFGYSRPFTTGGKLPGVETIGDGLILLGGGPWGAASEDRLLPTLDPEVRLVRACLMLGKPVIGIGLGSQILSLAADGTVEPAPLSFEIGTAKRTSPDALNGFLPETFPNIVYMRDRPRPPAYAEVIATNDAGEPAVFQVGEKAYGFAGHPGLRPAMIEDLIMEFDDAPENCADTLARLPAAAVGLEDALVPIMTGLIQCMGWMGD